MNLEEKEWVFINDLNYKIHHTENILEIQKNFLELIKFLIPYDMATFYLASEMGDHTLASPVGINISQEKLQRYIDYYQEIDYTKWILLSSKSTVYRETDLFSDVERENMTYFKEAYVPDNIYFSAYVNLVFNGVFVGVFALYRSKKNGDFSGKDLFVLELIKDHLALRLFRKSMMSQLPYLTPQKNIDLRVFSERHQLTPRETEVFYLLFEEINDDEICTKLFITSSTFKKHVLNIYRKIGVKNRFQLFKLVNKTKIFSAE